MASTTGDDGAVRAFTDRSADGVWRLALEALRGESASLVHSRNGQTREILRALIEITEPRQRWVYSRRPALNPAFAIAEVIWILRGRSDAGFLNHWNRSLPKFVGSDTHLEGAYGKRLRQSLGLDQLSRAANALRTNPESRQVVLQIWNSLQDLPDDSGVPRSADVPCNVVSLLKIREGRLEWTQVMRSNDLFRGLPYNIVQFTTLQEVLAGWIGVGLGSYVQLSDSLHQYEHDSHVMAAVNLNVLRNDEDLRLPYRESDRAFEILESFAIWLMLDGLTEMAVKSGLKDLELPQSYLSLAVILAAEEARRRQWRDFALEVLVECKNEPLRAIAREWINERS